MKVFKFGGASLKNADGIRNVASIILSHSAPNLLVVVSAMGKTTDLLERIVYLSALKQESAQTISQLKKYHQDIIEILFTDITNVAAAVHEVFLTIEKELTKQSDPDEIYD
ncbi:MAG: aspartate kinase, partial [Marivirga sp.]|nr:aspartate kinase [Marivirga sp.]